MDISNYVEFEENEMDIIYKILKLYYNKLYDNFIKKSKITYIQRNMKDRESQILENIKEEIIKSDEYFNLCEIIVKNINYRKSVGLISLHINIFFSFWTMKERYKNGIDLRNLYININDNKCYIIKEIVSEWEKYHNENRKNIDILSRECNIKTDKVRKVYKSDKKYNFYNIFETNGKLYTNALKIKYKKGERILYEDSKFYETNLFEICKKELKYIIPIIWSSMSNSKLCENKNLSSDLLSLCVCEKDLKISKKANIEGKEYINIILDEKNKFNKVSINENVILEVDENKNLILNDNGTENYIYYGPDKEKTSYKTLMCSLNNNINYINIFYILSILREESVEIEGENYKLNIIEPYLIDGDKKLRVNNKVNTKVYNVKLYKNMVNQDIEISPDNAGSIDYKGLLNYDLYDNIYDYYSIVLTKESIELCDIKFNKYKKLYYGSKDNIDPDYIKVTLKSK